MSQENFWILFSKKIANEATPEELVELEKLIQQHPEWQYALQNLQDIWQTESSPDLSTAEDAYLLHLQRMKEKNIPFTTTETDQAVLYIADSSKKRKRILYTSIAVAASLVLVFFAFFYTNKRPASVAGISTQLNEISTRLGSKSRVQLPDGSIVWLNAGSKLVYGKEFGKDNREVQLSGEAFFDVVKDPSRPFVIHASNINIRVLGTVFNVRAYPEDETSETSLIHGVIEVSIKSRPNDKIILSPNEKLVVENKPRAGRDSTDRGEYEPVMAINKLKRHPLDSTVSETQWIDNKLVFDNEPLRDIVVKMERWFGIDIEIADSSLPEKRMTGKFESENIEQALEGLRYTSTTPFVFERKGNKIIIHR